MPLLNDNNFLFTNNTSMRKALLKSENIETMISVNSIETSPSDLQDVIKGANNDLGSFMFISENIPVSKADDALVAKTRKVR